MHLACSINTAITAEWELMVMWSVKCRLFTAAKVQRHRIRPSQVDGQLALVLLSCRAKSHHHNLRLIVAYNYYIVPSKVAFLLQPFTARNGRWRSLDT